jgi:hypothetical protein
MIYSSLKNSRAFSIIIRFQNDVRITRSPAGRTPATPGYSRPMTTCTFGNGLCYNNKSFPFAGRAWHTTDLPIPPAICTTFL